MYYIRKICTSSGMAPIYRYIKTGGILNHKSRILGLLELNFEHKWSPIKLNFQYNNNHHHELKIYRTNDDDLDCRRIS